MLSHRLEIIAALATSAFRSTRSPAELLRILDDHCDAGSSGGLDGGGVDGRLVERDGDGGVRVRLEDEVARQLALEGSVEEMLQMR